MSDDAMNQLAQSTISPETLVARWNKLFPIGTRVRYWTGDRDGIGKVSFTCTRACTLGAEGTPAVWVEGCGDYVALSHVEPQP